MEAKCKQCQVFYPTSAVVVTVEGIYCEDCLPVAKPPMAFFTFQFSWKGIDALTRFIDGDVSYEVLQTIETMRKAIDKKLMEQIRNYLDGEIRQSDS